MRISQKDLRRIKGRGSKYRNHKVKLPDGWSYDSKAEARYALRLQRDMDAGLIRGFMRQVSLPIVPGTRYIADFMVEGIDGSTHFVDVKGVETAQFKTKMKLIAHLYPWIEIQVVPSKWVAKNCPALPAATEALN